MKRFSKLLCFMLVFITVIAAFCTMSFAATVGEQLPMAEDASWQRIDDSNPYFVLVNYKNSNVKAGGYNGTLQYGGISSNLTFKFYGTKIRLIGAKHGDGSSSININIDGIVEGFSAKSGSLEQKIMLYEKNNMAPEVHNITITSTDYFYFDAIDIDSTGYLIDYYSPTNLTAAPSISKIDLSWDAVERATSYVVKRSETPGGPYETITTTSAITYTDNNVTNGITYYYVVTAIVNNVESDPSNEASATPAAPTDPEPSGNNAILEITMVTGEIKEYDLTASELQSFLSWYDGRSNGADKAYYMIPKKNNIKPFLSRKDYIAYDKISNFEVKEYTE